MRVYHRILRALRNGKERSRAYTGRMSLKAELYHDSKDRKDVSCFSVVLQVVVLLISNNLAYGSLNHCMHLVRMCQVQVSVVDHVSMAKKPKCKECPHWEYTKTIGSPDVPEWHCRFGFSPSDSCQEMAEYNIKCKREWYKKHPEELQLKIRF